MQSLINLITNHPFNNNDEEILSAYRSLTQEEWDFIIAEIGFDPREEDSDESEYDLAQFISCDIGGQLLDAIAQKQLNLSAAQTDNMSEEQLIDEITSVQPQSKKNKTMATLISFHLNPVTREVTAEFTKSGFDKAANWLRNKGCQFKTRQQQLTTVIEFTRIPVDVAAKITERYNSLPIR